MGSHTRTAGAALAVVAVTGLTVAAGAPAGAAAAEPPQPSAKASRHLEFVKNRSNPSDSRLRLVAGSKVVKSYRSGSGTTTSPCAVGRGWLPNGTYRIEFHQKDFDGLINGYVIKISDKKCGNVTRTELFIHSEMTPSGGQGSIESERWDGASDYASNGCIKLTPAAVRSLFKAAGNGGWPAKLTVK